MENFRRKIRVIKNKIQKNREKFIQFWYLFILLGLFIWTTAIIYKITVVRYTYSAYMDCHERAHLYEDGECTFCENPLTPQVDADDTNDPSKGCEDPITLKEDDLRNLYILQEFGFILLVFIGLLFISTGLYIEIKSLIDDEWKRHEQTIRNEQPDSNKRFMASFIFSAVISFILLSIIAYQSNHPDFDKSTWYGGINWPLLGVASILMIICCVFYPIYYFFIDKTLMAQAIAREKRRVNMLEHYRTSVMYFPLRRALEHFEFRTGSQFSRWLQIKAQDLKIIKNNLYVPQY